MTLYPKLREVAGLALIGVGIAGLVLPIVPGLVLIASGTALLGSEHSLVRRVREWLERNGMRKRQNSDRSASGLQRNSAQDASEEPGNATKGAGLAA